MFKHLMATTALVGVLATPAIADEHTGMLLNDNEYESTRTEAGYFEADVNQLLASNLIGSWVYSSAEEDAETVGDVNDIILSPNGGVEAVIIGVGGFLGIGEKDVAVGFDRLEWQQGEDGERWLVAKVSKEELEAAPEFDRDIAGEDENFRRGERDTSAMDEEPVEGATEEMAEETEETAEETTAMATEGAAEVTEEVAEANEEMTEEAAETEAEMTEEPAEGEETTEMASTESSESMEAGNRVAFTDAKLEATEIIGMRVYGANDEDLGEISEILLSKDGQAEGVIIDVGGFLGIGEKPVAVAFDAIELARSEDDMWSGVYTNFTEEELEAQPAYDEDAYKGGDDSMVMQPRS